MEDGQKVNAGNPNELEKSKVIREIQRMYKFDHIVKFEDLASLAPEVSEFTHVVPQSLI